MLKSRPLIVQIGRPYEYVYAFLSDPTTLVVWGGAEPGSTMTKVGDMDYIAELARGPRRMHFTRPNAFGVLDYQVFEPDGTTGLPVTPARLHANGEGCDFTLLWRQRPGVSDEQFESECDWAQSDLLRLKSYLETLA